jgi:DNA-binding MarR family transcriptional regulator
MQARDASSLQEATNTDQACINAAPRLPDEKAKAWVGFLATHAQLTRCLDVGLGAEFGLSLSALEVLSRIAWQEQGQLRMSDLAHGALLSQSRVSRLVDELTARGLVERTSCPNDSRGVYAHITTPGRELVGRALEWHWEQVNERFFGSLTDEQIRELGAIWGEMLDRPDSA